MNGFTIKSEMMQIKKYTDYKSLTYTAFPENFKLDKIMPNNLFLMKQATGNFDYLSIVCITPADIRVVILDILA